MSRCRKTRSAFGFNVTLGVLILALPGCDFFSGSAPVNVPAGVQYEPIVTIDAGKSLIMYDVQFENQKLTGLESPSREAYLAKCAFAKLDHKKMADTKHKSMERCIVRIVMLTSLDQYQKPVWGSAQKIAELEIDLGKFRKNGKSAADYEDSQIGEFFVSRQFYHENVKSQPLTLVTIK